MTLGGQTITLQDVTLGARGRQGIRDTSTTDTDVAGCLFRSVSSSEPTGGPTDTVTQMFKVTVPPVAAALAADETWLLVYNGQAYEVTAVLKYPDFSGAIDHVTFMCRKWLA